MKLEVRFILLLSIACFITAGCSYGPVHTEVSIGHAAAKPGSHLLAVSVDYARVQNPTGLINTFPNGGIPRIVAREARVYLCDLDAKTVRLAAAVEGYAGIPRPSQVWIDGWRGDTLYFSLRGYGGSRWRGDDLSDPRRITYHLTGQRPAEKVDKTPTGLEQEDNSGPADSPPFLRFNKKHRALEITIDTVTYRAEQRHILQFDPQTGKPGWSVKDTTGTGP